MGAKLLLVAAVCLQPGADTFIAPRLPHNQAIQAHGASSSTSAPAWRRATQPHRGPRRPCMAASADYEVTVGDDGTSSLVVRLPGSEIKFETGRIGRLAHGAVMATDGETVVFTTACAAIEAGALDFVPLKVDYMERFSAAGMTSGSYNKRDGRASDKEILISRLMDRPLRPMIAEGWTHETQLLSWVLSYDCVRPTEPLAITSASAALYLSHIPMSRPVAGVTVGMDDAGNFLVNANRTVFDEGRLALTLAGTADGVLMIEGACSFLTEEQMMQAVEAGHAAVRTLCQALEAWGAAVGQPKKTETLRVPPPELKKAVAEAFTEEVDAALRVVHKADRGAAGGAIEEAAIARFTASSDAEVSSFDALDVKICLKKLWAARLRHMVRTTGQRPDGRKSTEVRPIGIELGVLPRTHGSALFTRGETQALATVTLGGGNMQQRIESIDGTESKRFYLQYSFPPSSVGEVGRTGAPGRREVGHGSLAERALAPLMPPPSEFPYSARVESLITESSGSSSMASVCGGSLALMDAGIPVLAPVAGVAMGLLLDEEAFEETSRAVAADEAVILTDILGLEDALGTMDFKVAGTSEAITSFQLDIKCEGLTTALMGRAMAQAKQGRLHILQEMSKALSEPRNQLSRHVPAATVVKVLPEQIGRVIGPGGKTIRQIIVDFNLTNVEIEDDGTGLITSDDPEKNERAKKFIEVLLADEPRGRRGGRAGSGSGAAVDANGTALADSGDGFGSEPRMVPVVGEIYRGCEVRGVHSYGAFVQLGPGIDGLCHVSELDSQRVRSVEAFLKVGDKLDVKLLAINERGQLRLSRKAVLADDAAAAAAAAAAAGGGQAAAAAVAGVTAEPNGAAVAAAAAATVAAAGESAAAVSGRLGEEAASAGTGVGGAPVVNGAGAAVNGERVVAEAAAAEAPAP